MLLSILHARFNSMCQAGSNHGGGLVGGHALSRAYMGAVLPLPACLSRCLCVGRWLVPVGPFARAYRSAPSVTGCHCSLGIPFRPVPLSILLCRCVIRVSRWKLHRTVSSLRCYSSLRSCLPASPPHRICLSREYAESLHTCSVHMATCLATSCAVQPCSSGLLGGLPGCDSRTLLQHV